MKNVITIFGAIIFASFILASCGQNDNKQKELELKERELALKEKEFALKEKGISQNDSIGEKPITLASPKQTVSTDNSLSKLVVNLQQIEGTLGQVTFSQKGKTLFYFERKPKKGKIVINGNEHILKKLSFDSNNGSYKISGDQVLIHTPSCKYNEDEEGDCAYGKFSTVTITLNGVSTTIKNVELQDCPDMDF